MRDWFRRYDVLGLGAAVTLQLLGPGLIGLGADLLMDTWPWGILTGSLVGVFFATTRLTRTIQRRYEALAPTDAEEEHP